MVPCRPVRLLAWPTTDVGRVRSHNEDSHLVDPALGLYLVADGMGGHAGGAHASQLCVDVVDKVMRRGIDALGRVAAEHRTIAIAEMLAVAASEASARIHDQANADHRLQGMGTTLTGLFVYGDRGYVVHVGDSRAFLLRGGTCRQLTTDHSWLVEQVQAGRMTEEEAAASDLKHIITRSVGFERQVEPDVVPLNINLGDAFLLCSDGLSNYIEADEFALLARDHWYADLPRVCMELANKRGGDDNITAIAILACNDEDDRRPAPHYGGPVQGALPPAM